MLTLVTYYTVTERTDCECEKKKKFAPKLRTDKNTVMADVEATVVKSEATESSTSISNAQLDAVVKSENAEDSTVKIKTEENEIQEDCGAELSDADGSDAEPEETTNAEKAEVELCPRETGFTSEKFKIEITGLPRRFGFKVL